MATNLSEMPNRGSAVARALSWLCVIGEVVVGAAAIAGAISPNWFFHSGEESMAWAIGIVELGGTLTLIGILMAGLSGKGKSKRLVWNLLFVVCWVVAESVRVSLRH